MTIIICTKESIEDQKMRELLQDMITHLIDNIAIKDDPDNKIHGTTFRSLKQFGKDGKVYSGMIDELSRLGIRLYLRPTVTLIIEDNYFRPDLYLYNSNSTNLDVLPTVKSTWYVRQASTTSAPEFQAAVKAEALKVAAHAATEEAGVEAALVAAQIEQAAAALAAEEAALVAAQIEQAAAALAAEEARRAIEEAREAERVTAQADAARKAEAPVAIAQKKSAGGSASPPSSSRSAAAPVLPSLHSPDSKAASGISADSDQQGKLNAARAALIKMTLSASRSGDQLDDFFLLDFENKLVENTLLLHSRIIRHIGNACFHPSAGRVVQHQYLVALLAYINALKSVYSDNEVALNGVNNFIALLAKQNIFFENLESKVLVVTDPESGTDDEADDEDLAQCPIVQPELSVPSLIEPVIECIEANPFLSIIRAYKNSLTIPKEQVVEHIAEMYVCASENQEKVCQLCIDALFSIREEDLDNVRLQELVEALRGESFDKIAVQLNTLPRQIQFLRYSELDTWLSSLQEQKKYYTEKSLRDLLKKDISKTKADFIEFLLGHIARMYGDAGDHRLMQQPTVMEFVEEAKKIFIGEKSSVKVQTSTVSLSSLFKENGGRQAEVQRALCDGVDFKAALQKFISDAPMRLTLERRVLGKRV